ncbi:MAG: ABC transporter permease [Prevotella sp.]|nr:ABC transporter permease [Prevotella sp.]
MDTGLILHTILGLLLLLIPAGALYMLERQMLPKFVLAVGRMVAQLLVLCLVVWALLRVNSPWLLIVWLVAMAVYAGWIVLKRCKLNIGKLLPAVSIGLFVSTAFTGLWILALALPVRIFEAHWFVPVMALLMGHAMAMMIRGLNTYVSTLKTDEQQYEFLRGNGQSHFKALQPFLRRSLLAVLSPTIANLSVLCLTSMPLLLGGILLGGQSPLNAFVLMLLMTVGCIAASVLSLAITLFLADRSFFDKFGKMMTVLALMALVMACKGNKVGEGAEAVSASQETNGFYQPKAETPKAEVQAAGKKIVMYEMPAALKDRPEQILKRQGYTTSYNEQTRNPNWVAWHLTKSHTYGSFQRKNEVFTEDESVKAPRATDKDYYNSRYDRGHMCPAGDNKWDKKAMEQSFLFTNICPQNHGLNKYEWNDLEILCRDWAREYGAIDIVCGPIYYQKSEQKTIGRNKVWVPDAFFKVVLCRQGSPKAIGFIYRNEGVKQKMEEAVYTVDEIEQLTGMDFFPALDDKTEDRIEAKASLSEW